MKHTTTYLLLALMGLCSLANATCNPNIVLTRPDSRYESVVGATPAGSEVRDTVTGLIWQRCVVGMVWNGSTCTGTASSLTWQNALDAARTATSSTAATGAAATWRVPNHVELFSLAERACDNPVINTTWFTATPSVSVWSSSPSVYSVYSAWSINFANSLEGLETKGTTNSVRLVRSGS